MDEEERSYARQHPMEHAGAVPCPRCGAETDTPCRSSSGRERGWFHAPRVEAFLASLASLVLLVVSLVPAVELPS